MPLTDAAIRTAKPDAKPYKLADGGGLFLLVNPGGSRLWRLKYRFLGKENALALGAYPEVSLATARDRRNEAKRLLSEGIDPSDARKAAKRDAAAEAENTFGAVAEQWLAKLEREQKAPVGGAGGSAGKAPHDLGDNAPNSSAMPSCASAKRPGSNGTTSLRASRSRTPSSRASTAGSETNA